MPSKNTIKSYAPESYYHVYFHGNNKQKLFIEPADYRYFLTLLQRYLSLQTTHSPSGMPYPNLSNRIKLYAFCLMGNHAHLLIYQLDSDALPKLMRCVLTSYSRYFNTKYKQTGALYESRYKAVLIHEQSYLEHISRYIHLNPRRWQSYKFSSLKYYRNPIQCPSWLNTDRILAMFSDPTAYIRFLEQYDKSQDVLDTYTVNLADK